jgi:hypothetical protein
MTDRPRDIRRQWTVYGAIVAAAFVLAMVPGTGPWFERLFGGIRPALVVLSAGAIGGACLEVLRRVGGFEILRRSSTVRGVAVGARLAVALAVAGVVADLILRYPEGINAPMPVALAFYPSVGLVAEVVFHLLPLALVLLLPLRHRLGVPLTTRVAIVVAAAAEPTFQVFFGSGSPAITIYTWAHVFAISMLQLYVFRRYDFVSMHSFRLVYYACWHVAWGVIRLDLLF